MKRFQGQALSKTPRIALITNDALGNYVVVTPLLQMLRQKYPGGTLHYFGGSRTQELWERETLIDWAFPLFGTPPAETVRRVRESDTHGMPGYDLIVNLESSVWPSCFAGLLAGPDTFIVGPCIDEEGRGFAPYADDDRGDLWRDKSWTAEDITTRYPFLSSGFIGEIFCRACYLEGPIPSYRVACEAPDCPLPNVLIATAASLTEKLWPVESWLELVGAIQRRGLTVGLLGAKPTAQNRYWQGGRDEDLIVDRLGVTDLRGQFSLPQVAGALRKAQFVLSLDNGILHLAAAAGATVTGLFREGISRLWAPPVKNLKVVTPGPGMPVASITPEEVKSAIGI